MQEKEVENPLLISNFEVHKSKNRVVIFVNSKIFPISFINKAASLFKEKAWVAIDGSEDEILVELKPKIEANLELLAREFNNELLNQTKNEIKIDTKSNALISKIKEVVSEFVREEQGRISKQSILTIGAILATLGLAEIVSASHACAPPPDYGFFGGDGGGGDGGGGCDGGGGGGGGCCLTSDSLILVSDNTHKKISDLGIGDKIKSMDINTYKIVTTKVTKVIKQHPREFYYSINEALFITNDHPVLVLRGNLLTWCRVEELIIGDFIKSLDGYTEVKSIKKLNLPVLTVYLETESGNFIVYDGSDYYIVKSNYMPADFGEAEMQKQLVTIQV